MIILYYTGDNDFAFVKRITKTKMHEKSEFTLASGDNCGCFVDDQSAQWALEENCQNFQ